MLKFAFRKDGSKSFDPAEKVECAAKGSYTLRCSRTPIHVSVMMFAKDN